MKETLVQIIDKSKDRFMFCTAFIETFNLKRVAELGVYKGDFAKHVLEKNHSIETYTMIDPWRNLSDWNKPANTDNTTFEAFYQETMQQTDFAKAKRKVLRGKTTEVIDQIQDESHDLVYIDGDHTLKGIAIDLINLWPKVEKNGFIIGDDFTPSIWQHRQKYEPTMVFPFAVYFAEAVNAKIYGLPYNQFLIAKGQTGFQFIDLTDGKYASLDLRSQFLHQSQLVLGKIKKTVSLLFKK